MKAYLFHICLPLLAAMLCACETTGELQVQNTIRGAVIKDVRWGDLFIQDRLLSGETSRTSVVYDQPTYGIDLPAAYPIKFYMEVKGDLIYLETREHYVLDIDKKVKVVLTDSTEVFNPVLE